MLLIQVDFYKRKADSGDPEAQLALRQLYYYDVRGFDQNIDRALELFERSAIQGAGEGLVIYMQHNNYKIKHVKHNMVQHMKTMIIKKQNDKQHKNFMIIMQVLQLVIMPKKGMKLEIGVVIEVWNFYI